MESTDGALVSEYEEYSPPLALPNSAELSPNVIAAHMQDIAMEDKEYGGNIESSKDKEDDNIKDQENSDSVGTSDIDSTVDNEDLFDGGNISKAYTQFNNLLSFQPMDDVSLNALKLIELLQLVRIDKG